MEKKHFMHAVRKERDQMLLLGSFSLPKLSRYDQGKVASDATGLRRRGYVAWHDFNLL